MNTIAKDISRIIRESTNFQAKTSKWPSLAPKADPKDLEKMAQVALYYSVDDLHDPKAALTELAFNMGHQGVKITGDVLPRLAKLFGIDLDDEWSAGKAAGDDIRAGRH
jgi:hypothetical protein